MNLASRARDFFVILTDVFGFQVKDKIAVEKRIRQVTAVTTIAISFGFCFSIFNFLIPGMAALGVVELIAVGILVPASILGRKARFVTVAEDLVMLATLFFVGALIAFGGIEGTGLLWVYVAPFLAFFLKGQRAGWWYSLGVLILISMYFVTSSLFFPHYFYQHSPVTVVQFLISLFFYTLVAAAFNLLRTRFEEQLQEQVTIKTADAQKLLSQLQFLATHDQITQLPNKVLLVDILKKQISEINVADQILVVCILKLERMFEMSTILGPAGADHLVLKIAEYVGRFVEARGALAHTHRDEFVISYPVDRASFNPDELQSLFSERQISIEVQGYFIFCETTMGFAVYPDHDTDPQTILNKAQQAMLQAHKNGQQWLSYDSKQEKAFVRHHLLFGKLRAALVQQHLQVHFQPQIDLITGLVVGAEALLRWNDPTEGPISPMEFIPLAEESGLIRPLTTWLVDVCMRECAAWRKQEFELQLSINLSARSLLDPELLHVLQDSLKKYNLSAFDITLEITESCFMSSPERAMEVIQRLHETGFRLSIDDFGTGYSSLSYLKNLPVNELKIDKSFVHKLLLSSGDQAIVSSTIDLAHNFGLMIVAEGIEDESTGNWLQTRGCDIGQGYYFAKPMNAEAFVKYLLTNLIDHKPSKEINLNNPFK